MARPIVLGVVGDSGAGKTTLTRGLARVLGERSVSYVSGDDYHRYARAHRAELGITPLRPEANHLDIMGQHLGHLRRWEPILKPVYSHRTGTLEAPKHVRPGPFVLVEGLLNFHTEPLRQAHDIRVFLAPPERMRRAWKLTRDCTRRGYTTHEVLEELDLRERDAAAYLRPQRAHADIVVAFRPGTGDRPEHLDAEVILRDTLRHPDLSPLIGPDGRGPTLVRREHESVLRIPGQTHPELAAELEEAVWQRMQYASTCACSDWASSWWGRSCGIRSRWRSSSRCCSTTWSRRGPRSAPGSTRTRCTWPARAGPTRRCTPSRRRGRAARPPTARTP